MLEPVITLIALQGAIIARYLELSASLLGVCLWWLPAVDAAAPLSPSRNLVPVTLSAAS